MGECRARKRKGWQGYDQQVYIALPQIGLDTAATAGQAVSSGVCFVWWPTHTSGAAAEAAAHISLGTSHSESSICCSVRAHALIAHCSLHIFSKLASNRAVSDGQ